VDPADVLPWNAYPWYINTKPTTAQLAAGIEPLRRVIELMPQLRVILLLGKDAQRGWRLFTDKHPKLTSSRGVTALSTYHPSRRALQHRDHVERTRREDDIRATLQHAAMIMTSSLRPSTPTRAE
jgi:uracil-DNA glycosylase